MALKPCIEPLCGALSTSTRCPTCTKARDNTRYAQRGTTAQRGLSGVHAAISRYYKRIDAACTICGKRGTPANPITAGHLIARSKGGTNDPDNYQPECRSCGSKKQDK